MKLFLATMLAGLGWMTGMSLASAAPVTVSVDVQNPGQPIAADFSGLSFEIAQLLPHESGVHYFRPDNEPLLQLFHTLGIKNLRIGGNTSDRDAKQLPDEADIDSLFAFAKAADVKVIYCLRLHNGDVAQDVQTVKYIMAHYASQMDGFSIGQEPSAYPRTAVDNRPAGERMGAAAEKYSYAKYAADWKKFADAIIAAAPDVKFCGPSVHNNAVWAQKFIADFGHDYHVGLITEHLYPGGAGGKVPTPEIGRDRMLTTNFTRAYEHLYNGFVPLAASNGLPCRLEEVNNYFNGGATNVSNTFASALWGLDFMYWWAGHGLAGLNFHTGDKVAAGSELRASRYTAYFSTPDGFNVRPLGYGITAFTLGSHGNVLPATVTNPDNLNLSVYPVRNPAGYLCLTIINQEHGATARDATVSLSEINGHPTTGQMLFLSAPNHDIAATTGETLGGAVIENNGTWHGQWSSISTVTNGVFTVTVPAATAAIITLPTLD